MKQADVKIGATYLTKIGDRQAKVVVVDQVNDCYSGRVKFRIRKAVEGSPVLPKYRAASALHPLDIDLSDAIVTAPGESIVDKVSSERNS